MGYVDPLDFRPRADLEAPQSIPSSQDLGRFPRSRLACNPRCPAITLTWSFRPQAALSAERPVMSRESDIRHSRPQAAAIQHSYNAHSWQGLTQSQNLEAQIRAFARITLCETSFDYSGLEIFCIAPPLDYCSLLFAAVNGHHAQIADLIDGGADVDTRDESGLTALHYASIYGHTRTVEFLLDHGATIDAAASGNVTPLAYAVGGRMHDVKRLLLSRGAIVDAPVPLQAVVLSYAALNGDVDIVQTILDLGFDVDATCGYGMAALHLAVSGNKHRTIDLLLRRGADVNARRSGDGSTPLAIAAGWGNAHVFELLLESGALVDLDVLFKAVYGGNAVIITRIFELHPGIDVNVVFEDGTIPLTLASEEGNYKAVEFLLTHGADPDIEAKSLSRHNPLRLGTWKALHAAAHQGELEVARLLLQHDADVNARTERGETPLLLALQEHAIRRRYDAERFAAIIEMLLSWGAVPDEHSSPLLEEFESEADSSHRGCTVPGAWQSDSDSEDTSDSDVSCK